MRRRRRPKRCATDALTEPSALCMVSLTHSGFMEVAIDESRLEDARLAVSRHAARLFWTHGFDATSGDDIAAAAGLSKRTVWRYFRSKEACVEPVMTVGELRFMALLQDWPADVSIEAYLHSVMANFATNADTVEDAIASARILSILHREPALRSAWLMACHAAEHELAGIIAARAHLSPAAFEVRLCAATITAAIRLVDEEISAAVINDGVRMNLDQITDRIAAAFRTASILPICDPVT
jgi:AcrR family transcriptional regulator